MNGVAVARGPGSRRRAVSPWPFATPGIRVQRGIGETIVEMCPGGHLLPFWGSRLNTSFGRRIPQPMRYLEYKVVEEMNRELFEKAINDLIQQGWEPHGTLLILPRHDNEIANALFQAMVKIDRG